MRSYRSSVVAIFLLLWLACKTKTTSNEETNINTGRLTNSNFFFSLPYETTQGDAMVITVMINGRKRRFMIDTGAPLIISKAIQDECDFPLFQQTRLRDSNNDTSGVKIIVVKDLSVAELNFKGIPALVLDFSKPPFDCDSLDGFIGSNLLRLLVVQFNKPQKRIYFGDHIDSFKLAGQTSQLNMYLNHSQSDPRLEVKINNNLDSILFDTGDRTLYTLAKEKFDLFNQQPGFEKLIALRGKGLGSQGVLGKNKDSLDNVVLKIDSFALAGSRINNIHADLTYSTPSRVGRGLLDYGIVTMDYLQKKFYFSPVISEEQFHSLPDIGLRFQERDDKLVVSVVWNNTEAFKKGVRPGDEILSLGSFVPANSSKCFWSEFVRKESKAPSVVVVLKNADGETKKLTLHQLVL